MYRKFCGRNGVKTTELRRLPGRVGVSELAFLAEGAGAAGLMAGESGGHRVQRVPPTEKRGRRQSSTVTVAVLPAEGFDRIRVARGDVGFQSFRAGGKGGQNQNKVSTAVRLTHRETGETVVCREERYQARNRETAFRRLEDRLNRKAEAAAASEEAADRKAQVGLGMRGDKVRTYNFRENRVTDHRTGKSTHRLDEVVRDGRLELIR